MQKYEKKCSDFAIESHLEGDLWYNPGMTTTTTHRNSTPNRTLTGLARLLATENISVQHQPVPTASFDTGSRVLTLPVWNDMPGFLYDMLVGHEVGHALYTPAGLDAIKDAIRKVAPRDANTAKSYLNIVEDVRIERMMKDKFPGLRRDFVKGYADLFGREFFGEDLDANIGSMQFADRFNIHFKIGIMGHMTIAFNAEEQAMVDEAATITEWDEVVDLAARMYAYSAQNEQDSNPAPEAPADEDGDVDMPAPDMGDDTDGPQGQGGLPDDIDDWDNEDEGESASGDTGEEGDESSDDSDSTSGSGDEDGDGEDSGDSMEDDTDDGESAESTESKTASASKGSEEGDSDEAPMAARPSTQDRADRMMEDLADKRARSREYVTLPDNMNTDKFIVKGDDFDALCEKNLGAMSAEMTENWKTFQKENRPVVQNMVKQFEMKQSADSYRRTSPSKTGRLDMGKLHQYKITEDLFLRGTQVREGKNHGLVMLIDWSGSMCEYMKETIHQMLNLAMFARSINVPFEVYSFTSNTRRGNAGYGSAIEEYTDYCDYKPGDVLLSGFELHNWLSSKMNKVQFNRCATNMLEVAGRLGGYNRLGELDLGGTPLNEALVAMNDIIPAFQKENNVQITNLVVLTDGESTGHPCSYHWTGDFEENENGYKNNGYDYNQGVTAIKRGNKVTEIDGRRNETSALCQILREDHGCQVIGMYLASKKDVVRNIRWNSDFETAEELIKKFKKDNFAILEKVGYDEYYLLPIEQKIENDALADLDADATRTKIRNAFIKGAKAKKSSRTVLSRFAERVAKGLNH